MIAAHRQSLRASALRLASVALGLLLMAATPDYQGLIHEGLRAYSDQRYAEARQLFASAHALEASARTLRALGITDLALDNFSLARDELEAALAHPTAPLTAEQRKEVTELLAWMRANLGSVQLQCTPLTAAAAIDGRAVRSPEVLLAPDEHELTVSAPGYKPEVRKFQVVLARPLTLHVQLVAAGPAPAPALSGREAPAPAAPPAREPEAPSQSWLWVGSAGVLLAAAGGGLLIAGLDDKARVQDAASGVPLSKLEAAHDRVPWLTGSGIALGALGLGGIGAAAILLLTRAPTHPDVAWNVQLAPNAVGVSARF